MFVCRSRAAFAIPMTTLQAIVVETQTIAAIHNV
jgi:hypothetical protein